MDSTQAQTHLDAQMMLLNKSKNDKSPVRLNNIDITKHRICAGCNQALVPSTSRDKISGTFHTLDSPTNRAMMLQRSTHSDKKGISELLASHGVGNDPVSGGTSSYSNVLCDDCLSKQL